MPIRRAALALALLAAALAAGPARAAELEVSPVLLELSAAARSALLSVRNAGASPARLQVKAFAWAERPEGGMDLAPAPEVLVFPPLLELAPGASRNVRVGISAEPGAAERAFRLFVEELPPAREPGAPSEIRVLTRIGIPLFLQPAAPEPRPEIAALAVSDGRVAFTLRNGGTSRFRPDAVEVVLAGEGGAPLRTLRQEGWYVLAGGERRYAFDVPREEAHLVRAVIARAVAPAGAVEARLALPGGARGP